MSLYTATPAARHDLFNIWRFIARDNPEAADRIEAEIRNAFIFLSKTPQAGHVRKDLTTKPVRFHPVRHYLIVYRDTTPIQIVRVLHGARNIARLLRVPAE